MATATRPEQITEDELEAEQQQQAGEVFLVNGRIFRRAKSTSVDQDAYVTRRLRHPKIAAIIDTFAAADPDSGIVARIGDLSTEILWEAFENGSIYEILAGSLVEDGVKWNRQVAARVAAELRDLSSDREKAAIFDYAGDILLRFFRTAAVWSESFSRLAASLRKPTTENDADPESLRETSPLESPDPR